MVKKITPAVSSPTIPIHTQAPKNQEDLASSVVLTYSAVGAIESLMGIYAL